MNLTTDTRSSIEAIMWSMLSLTTCLSTLWTGQKMEDFLLSQWAIMVILEVVHSLKNLDVMMTILMTKGVRGGSLVSSQTAVLDNGEPPISTQELVVTIGSGYRII